MTSDLNNIINIDPYSLAQPDKQKLFYTYLHSLISHHYRLCEPYKKIIDKFNFSFKQCCTIDNIPYLPVRIFKTLKLMSIDEDKIDKTMMSSGTSGNVSKIYLDRNMSILQSTALSKIITSYIGKKRLPLLILDCKGILKNRDMFSARAAGILGFSMFGRDITYALDDNLELDIPSLFSFLEKNKNRSFLIFGFTYIAWEYFFKKIKQHNLAVDLSNGILFHGGGWKKMLEKSVDNFEFKKYLNEVTGIKSIHNYYGMVEQAGSIFVECENGYFHCSILSDVLVRDAQFLVCPYGKKGFLQLMSLLPHSYPGHVILTEDEGEIVGEDDCSCGRLGKYFKIYGRVKQAEMRGCSDTLI